MRIMGFLKIAVEYSAILCDEIIYCRGSSSPDVTNIMSRSVTKSHMDCYIYKRFC